MKATKPKTASDERQEAEAARIAAVKERGQAPDGVGPEIVAMAPGRGQVYAFDPVYILDDGKGGMVIDRGYKGRKALRCADVFHKINAAIERRGASDPFQPCHITAARAYAEITERLDAAGYKASSAFAAGGSIASPPTRDASERLAAMIAKLREAHVAIGSGTAMAVRRVRPSARAGGQPRATITDRDLVDMVAIHGRTLSGALEARGWCADRRNTKAVYLALWATLDRLARCF